MGNKQSSHKHTGKPYRPSSNIYTSSSINPSNQWMMQNNQWPNDFHTQAHQRAMEMSNQSHQMGIDAHNNAMHMAMHGIECQPNVCHPGGVINDCMHSSP